MSMGGGNTSSGGSSRSRAILSEINVTPLVDVMLVLLIMFMVTTPLMQQGIDVDLPKTSSTGMQATEEPLVMVISAEKKISIAKQRIEMSALKERLITIFQSRDNKQIYIQADKNVDYGTVAQVMAEVRTAGIYNISLVTLPKE